MLEWDSINSSTESMVQEEAYIKKAQQPSTGRCTRPVKDSVGGSLDCLETSFCWVLVLLMWLTLPMANKEGTEDVLYFLTNFHLCMVAD